MEERELKLSTITYEGEEYIKVSEAAKQYRDLMTTRGLTYWHMVELLQKDEGWSPF